ncbi:MAG: hypothetical protein RL701_3731, partial [Pseudomonadota bacterium]
MNTVASTAPVVSASVEQLRFTPGKRLAWALGACLPLFVLGSLGMWLGVTCDVLLLALALWEARDLRARRPQVTRRLPLRFALDEAQSVGLALRNDSDKPLRGVLHDDAPGEFSVERERLAFALAPQSTMLLEYDARAPRRGEYNFGAISLRLDGALGLGALIVVQPAAASVRVYPNPRGPRRYELALRQNVLHSLGVRRSRALGSGGEFEQLRDYVPGDAL